jgi:hypothetical protein
MQQAFRNINGKLYITFKAMVDVGVSSNYLKKEICLGRPSWMSIKDPLHKSKVLICYETLKDKYKVLVHNAYGDPYQSVTLEPLRGMIRRDMAAVKFFDTYRLPNGNKLPTKPVNYPELYAHHAQLFNMISYVMENKRIMKMELCMTMDTFWESVVKIIGTDRYAYLPQTVDNIKKRWRKYQEHGYASLISSKFGNSNTLKIHTEEQKAVLLKLIAAHQNLEDTVVCNKFNQVAAEMNWGFKISAPTVRIYRKKHDMEVAASRKGKSQMIHRLRTTLKRDKPKYAGVLFEYDGWTTELLFQATTNDKTTGKKKVDYNARLQLMTVYDPYNDYIVGYHIGKENTDNIIEAIKNAVDNVYRMTGRYYLINELLTDNFGRGSLDKFYNRAAVLHRTPAVGNAKSKTIESFFNRLNKELFRTQFNTSGHNITSRKENQPNMDWMDKHKKYLPTVEQGYMQIEYLVQEHRSTREQAWLDSFNELVAQGRMHEIDRETYLSIFGSTDGNTNRLSNAGIRKCINKFEYTFDLLDMSFRRQTYTDWTIIYDTNDLSSVLAVNDDGTQSFLLQQKQSVPLAASEWTEEHHKIAQRTWGFNKHMESQVTESVVQIDARSAKVVQETALKTMFIHSGQQKKAIQNAQNVYEIEAIKHENTSEEGGVNAVFDTKKWWESDEMIEEMAKNNL